MNTSITVPAPILTPAEASYRKSMKGVINFQGNTYTYTNTYKEDNGTCFGKILEEAARAVWHNGGEVPKEMADKFLHDYKLHMYYFKLNQYKFKKTRSFI